MATYTIQAPDGNSYSVTGPDGATPAQVQAEVLRQNPSAGTPKGPAPAQPGQGANVGPMIPGRVAAPADGFNRGVAAIAGLPGDTLLNLRDLGAAALGSMQGAITGKTPSSAFDPVDRSQQWGSSDSIERALNTLGVATRVVDPTDPVQRYSAAAGAAVPGALAGGPMATARAALGGVAGQAVADQGGGAAAQILAQTLSNKTGISDAVKAAAAAKLASVEAGAAPRVRDAVAGAQDVAPGQQTVTQTTGSPFLAKIGQGVAGSKTVEASANIVDQLTKGMVNQAKAIAPLGVSNPEVAGKVQEALSNKDQALSDRADAIYQAGKTAVAKEPDKFSTDNSVGAVDQMLQEVADPRNLVPPVVTTRLQNMMQLLRPTPPTVKPSAIVAPDGRYGSVADQASTAGPAGVTVTPGQPGGTTAAGFMDLGKQINKLYDDVPSEAITPALNETFARLKSAWHADLAAAPDSTAKALIQKTNDVFSGIQDERGVLKNSVVAAVLGKDGKTSIADPDQVLNRLVDLRPEAQSYVRTILEQYAPDTLDQLRSYAITKNVTDAARGAAPASMSSTNPRALTPGKLADSGLFTGPQAAELNKRQDALSTALTALPEHGAPVAEVDPQSAGRLAFGGFNPTFLGGTAARVLTQGKLEQLLNTPEGRNNLLGINTGGKPPPSDVRKVIAMYQAAIAAQAASDRANRTSQSGPQPQGPAQQPVPPAAAPQQPIQGP
jgi:hypothetical protein